LTRLSLWESRTATAVTIAMSAMTATAPMMLALATVFLRMIPRLELP
jgi:hypothetical protein